MGFLVSAPIHMSNKTNIFWSCFKQALKDNKKNRDGKQRVLSIIANDFTYQELQTNLNVSDYEKTDNIFVDITNILKINISIELKVGEHTISESRKHANMCGYGAPPLSKPVITRSKLNDEQLKQFDLFFSDKENVNMSSYKTEAKTGLPVLYLQDSKSSLWEKFHEKYPDGMQRTAFMNRLHGSRYIFKENMGGLCSICNEYGYQIFSEIEDFMKKNIENIYLQVLHRISIKYTVYLLFMLCL